MTAAAPRDFSRLRVWLVHDWLNGMRGGEKVLLQLTRLFPNSRIATLFHIPGATHPDLDARVARTSFLQHVPRINAVYRNLLPLMPGAIRSISIDACDIVISTSHCVAKGVNVPRGTPHLCYCLTPMRYLWDLQEAYRSPGFALKDSLARLATPVLRDIDLALNDSVTAFATTSHFVADRIQRCYRRPATVIAPGFDDTFYALPGPSAAGTPTARYEPFYLIVSALVPYKRVDLAIEAFLAPQGAPCQAHLVIIGQGPDDVRLRRLARHTPHIHFLGWQPDVVVREHYQRCEALLFPGVEDFGLVPLEVQACGRPVIAYGRGGAVETVVPPRANGAAAAPRPTGVFFHEQTPAALRGAIADFEIPALRFCSCRLPAQRAPFHVVPFQRPVHASRLRFSALSSGTRVNRIARRWAVY